MYVSSIKVMPKAYTKNDKKKLGRAYAICSKVDKSKKERCVKEVYKKLKG
jgi:hypothetical protein